MKTRKILCMSYRPGNPSPSVNEETCHGDCYAYDDVLRVRGETWTTESIRITMEHLLKIHHGICGNQNYRLGIDLDEERGVYIGTFYRFGSMDVVTGSTVSEVVECLADAGGTYFCSDEYRADVARDPGLGKSACAHGDEGALRSWMAKVGGFDEAVLG